MDVELAVCDRLGEPVSERVAEGDGVSVPVALCVALRVPDCEGVSVDVDVPLALGVADSLPV